MYNEVHTAGKICTYAMTLRWLPAGMLGWSWIFTRREGPKGFFFSYRYYCCGFASDTLLNAMLNFESYYLICAFVAHDGLWPMKVDYLHR
jgi:hypothetical protein